MTAPAPTVEGSNSIPPTKDDPMEEAPQRKGVIGWVKGKIQKRNITNAMGNINLDEAEKAAIAATNEEPSELDIATGMADGGVVVDDDEVAEEDKIDLEAENDEGLLVGWGKKLQEVEWVKNTVQAVQENLADAQEQEELREIHEKYKDEIKADEDIKALQKKIKKITKNLKVQRLNGDRIGKRHTFERDKQQRDLDQKTSRLRKAIWTFSNSSMNSHEYAKAMMRASARLKRKGIKVHKSEKALAMEAAVLRNMHRMLAIQKQYTMAKRDCNDVSGFIKRCKGWLDDKLADGEMGIMVLEATSKSMAIMYAEVAEVQEALIPKLEDPKNHVFKKERMKTVLALPQGLRSMPTFLKGPKQPPMKISLRKKVMDENPNLRGYRTFKEQNKAMEIAWKQELKQYENQLLVGGDGFKMIEEVSELGDSEDEIEENLAAVSIGAAAAKKAKGKEEPKNVTFTEGEDKAEGETKDEKASEDKPEEEGEKAEEAKEDPAEEGEEKSKKEKKEKKSKKKDKKAKEEGEAVEEEEKPTEEEAAPGKEDKPAEEGEAVEEEEKPTEEEAAPAKEEKPAEATEEEKPAEATEEEKPAEEEEKPAEATEEEKPAEEEEKSVEAAKEETPAEETAVLDDDDTAGGTLETGGGDIHAPEVEEATEEESVKEKKKNKKSKKEDKKEEVDVDQSERSAESTPKEETPQEQEQADAAALEEAQKSGGEEDPEVDEAALPQEVKQEDLDKLLNKEADDVANEPSDHGDNEVEEGLAGVVEDALAGVVDVDGSSDDEEDAPVADTRSVQSTDVSV